MTNDDIVQRLDTLIAVQRLAHHDDIEKAKASIRSDKVNAEILDRTTKEVPAGKLTAAVRQKTRQSPATIRRRIAALVDVGALEKSGGGRTTAYKATGLV